MQPASPLNTHKYTEGEIHLPRFHQCTTLQFHHNHNHNHMVHGTHLRVSASQNDSILSLGWGGTVSTEFMVTYPPVGFLQYFSKPRNMLQPHSRYTGSPVGAGQGRAGRSAALMVSVMSGVAGWK